MESSTSRCLWVFAGALCGSKQYQLGGAVLAAIVDNDDLVREVTLNLLAVCQVRHRLTHLSSSMQIGRE